jgi:hypothetical protein
MNIKEWELRNKNPHLPADFRHQEGAKYASNWQYTKTLSNYHFDKWAKNDSKWYAKIGRFVGDWSADLQFLKNNCKIKPHMNRPWTGIGDFNPMREQELADLKRIYGVDENYSPYWHISSKEASENCPSFMKIVNHFKLDKFTFGVHLQKPGQFTFLHIDKFQQRNPEDTSKIIRLYISLENYDLGQFIGYGNDVYSHWQAGDIVIEDWANTPHSMINAGKEPLCWIGITGTRSEETDKILELATPESVYEIRV